MLTTTHVLLFSLVLFGIGVVGVLTRRNAIVILMSLEIVFNAANLNFIAFAWALPDVSGQVLALFVICVAAAEAAIGLAILITVYRNRSHVNVDEINLLKW
jgi:NADH-quinone oxidoreductase subunit K